MSGGGRKRANPFRSRDRAHFPPLDEFFRGPSAGGGRGGRSSPPPRTDAGNASATSPNASAVSHNVLNFSADMSIGDRAEMAQHRYLVGKYGVDCVGRRAERDDDDDGGGSPADFQERGPEPEGDDWDRIMDESCANLSFSSAAIAAAPRRGDDRARSRTPTPDQTCDGGGDEDDDGCHSFVGSSYSCSSCLDGSSFFDRSIIASLKTPEKVRCAVGEADGKMSGVTLRGQVHDSSDSPSSIVDDSYSSAGSGFERMFTAALRFHDDFDDGRSSLAKEDLSVSMIGSSGKDKSSSVSFAADTSFVTSEGRYPSNNHRRRLESSFECKLRECTSDNPIESPSGDESFGADSFKDFSLLSASPIQRRNDDQNFGPDQGFDERRPSPSILQKVERGEVSSLESPACSTPTVGLDDGRSGKSPKEREARTEGLLLLGLSPIDARVAERSPESLSSGPFESRPPDDEAVCRSPLPDNHDCAKKYLFPETGVTRELSTSLSLEIHHDSIEMIQKLPSEPVVTDPTMESEESFAERFSERTTPSGLSGGAGPFLRRWALGADAASRVNSGAADVDRIHSVGSTSPREECRRGVRLSRLSKMKELGLEHALSSSRRLCLCPERREDSSF